MHSEYPARTSHTVLGGTAGAVLSSVEEGVLLQWAKSGDGQAYAELYRRHARRVYHVVLRMTGSREDAEDVLQDAALQAYIHLKDFREQSAFSSWLTKIAINRVLMMRRRSRTVRSIPIDGRDGLEEIQLPDPAADTEGRLERQERDQQVERAICRLKPKFGVPLRMQLEHDLPVKDLANRLGISLSAAKSRLLRARTMIARHLQRNPGRSPNVAKAELLESEL